MRIEQFLEESAARRPDHVGLVCQARRLTYAKLDAGASSVAAGLRRLGVGRGDRVVVQLENGVEAVLTIFGILKAGAVFVLVNPSIKAEKLAYIANDCEAVALVTDVRFGTAPATCEQAPRLASIVLVGPVDEALKVSAPRQLAWFDGLLTRPADATGANDFRGIDADLAALLYTSGSSGLPKGVMLTHLNMVAAATSITTYLGMHQDDVVLNVLPLSFHYGLYQVLMSFKVSARVILERTIGYPAAMLDLLSRERVTGLPIVPTIAALLRKHDLQAYDLSALRYITSTGAALPASHIAHLRGQLPHVRIFSMYGLTECKRVSYLDPEDLDTRPTSVGKPMDGVEVFVEDESGQLHERGTGELVVRGSNVMQGYWRSAEETARALREGFLPAERLLRTGDVFRIDDDGYLYYVARKDDVIKSRGEKVSPREVENALHQIPGVLEAVVIGVPDPVLGQMVKAFVRLDPESQLTEQLLTWHAAQRLEDVMVPQAVEFLGVMPKTPNGKINRRELAARHASAA